MQYLEEMSKRYYKRSNILLKKQKYWDIEEFNMIENLSRDYQKTGRFYTLEDYSRLPVSIYELDFRYIDRFIRQFMERFMVPYDFIYYKEKDIRGKGFMRCYFMDTWTFLADIDGELVEIVNKTMDFDLRNRIYEFIKYESNQEFCRKYYYTELEKGFLIRRKKDCVGVLQK